MGKSDEIRRVETETLLKALGPIGMAKYLEECDDGGTGDYTKEKILTAGLFNSGNIGYANLNNWRAPTISGGFNNCFKSIYY